MTWIIPIWLKYYLYLVLSLVERSACLQLRMLFKACIPITTYHEMRRCLNSAVLSRYLLPRSPIMLLLSIGSLVLITYYSWVNVLTWLVLCVLIEIKDYSTFVVFPVRKILFLKFCLGWNIHMYLWTYCILKNRCNVDHLHETHEFHAKNVCEECLNNLK